MTAPHIDPDGDVGPPQGDEFWAGLAQEATNIERYRPTGDAPEIRAPDLERAQEVRNSTDRALADGFFRHYRHLFCNGDGQLYVYRPAKGMWSRVDIKSQLLAMSMHLADRFYDELTEARTAHAAARAEGREEQATTLAARVAAITALIVHCEKSNTMGSVARFVEAKLKTILQYDKKTMNPNPGTLMCANGLVDLRTGVVRHPLPEDYITRNTGVVYKHDVDCSWWEELVLQVFGGNKRLAEFVQVWMGYAASGSVAEHCMAIFHGTGRNGKNMIVDAVATALGEYSSALPAGFLDATGSQTSSMDNNLLYAAAQLDGIRFAYLSETNEEGKLRESWVKSNTGDMTMRARLAHQDYYEFKATHKFTISTNHKPTIRGTDDGVWERIRLVPFKIKFGDEEELASGLAQQRKIIGLLDKATSTAGREVVLAWLVAGAKKYFAHGLARYTPPEVAAETKAYRREQDVLGQFLQLVSTWVPPAEVKRIQALEGATGSNAATSPFGRLNNDERLRVENMELYRIYEIWSQENGHGARSATKFARDIQATQRFWVDEGGIESLMPPLEVVRGSTTKFYRYIRLSDMGKRLQYQARALRRQQAEERGSKHEDEDPRF